MIVVLTEIAFPQEQIERVRGACAPVESFCLGLDGCLAFSISFPLENVGIFRTTELWVNVQRFLGHIAAVESAPELADFNSLITGVQARVFEANEIKI